MIRKKILLIVVFLFTVSLLNLRLTHSSFSDTEVAFGNSIQIGTWGTTYPETPTGVPIATPTEEIVPTPTPTSEPSIIPWINEIHYDNVGTDTNEGVEIAGPAGTDLSGWTVVLYNGTGGVKYKTLDLSGVISNQQSGYGTVWIALPTDGLQNGNPDGIALVSPGEVIHFLSYEGTFTALDGPAIGITSIDIGVVETSSTQVGFSLQLQGTGNKYNDFTWVGPSANTNGAVNTNQTFN